MSYELELDKLRKAFGHEWIRIQDRVVWHVDVKCGWMRKENTIRVVKPMKIIWKPYMETITVESYSLWSDTFFAGPITSSTIGSIHAIFQRYRLERREIMASLGWTRGRFIGCK